MTELPAGLTVRAPQLHDAEAILQLAAGYFQRILGRPMVTLSEIIEGLTAPTITLERDGWLVLDADDQVTTRVAGKVYRLDGLAVRRT
jgi:hypothetical protein